MTHTENNNITALDEEYSSIGSIDLVSNFADMLKLIKRNLAKVIMIIVVFAIAALGVSVSVYKPIYKANVTFSITPLILSDSKSGVSVYEFNYVFFFAQQMNETFPHITNSNILRNSINYDLGRPMNGKIVPDPGLGSNIFKVTVESGSAQDAYDIMNSFIKCYPRIAEHIIGDIHINVIHSSGKPESPANPRNHFVHTALGAFIGLVLSMIIFFIMALYRETVKDKTDVTTKLNSNYICEIPHVSRKRTSNNQPTLIKISSKNPGFSESIRVLKKRVKTLLRSNEKVIAITSTTFGEGKTTVSYNLAQVFANGDERTLLIDMDFFHRDLQNLLLKDPSKCIGITDIVMGKSDFDTAICNVSKNFDILFCGSENCKYNNPKIAEVFEAAREKYDYIIVDTPPCGMFSDLGLVTHLCDNIIFTVKIDDTSIGSIKKALQYIFYSRARLIGFVINGNGAGGNYAGKLYYSPYKKYSYRYRYNHNYYSKYGYGIDSVDPKK